MTAAPKPMSGVLSPVVTPFADDLPWESRDDEAVAQQVKDSLFHLRGGNIRTYQRMIHHMDEGIGNVVDALKATGQLDNTLIVFTAAGRV